MERLLEELSERQCISEVGLPKQRPRGTVATEDRQMSQQNNQVFQQNYGKENQSGESLREHIMKHLREGTFHCQVCNEGFSRPPWLKDQLARPAFIHSGRDVIKEGLHNSKILNCADSNLNEKTCVRDPSCERQTVGIKRKRTTHFDELTHDQGGILKEDCSEHVCDTEESLTIKGMGLAFPLQDNCEQMNNENENPQGNHLADVQAEMQSDLTCDVCGNLSKRKRGSKHCMCKKTKKLYECSVCGRSFCFPNLLKKHMTAHSDKRPFVCSVCGKSYKYPSTLKDHVMAKHEGSRPRPYLCDLCGSAFAKPSQLQFHLTIHSGEKSFKCELCPKSFRSKSTLRMHVSWHNGERPHKCETCEKRFLNISSMVEHKRVHSGEKPFSCKICSRAFAHLRTLRNHERIHSGDKPYECDICHKRFIQLNGLNYHKKLHEKQDKK